MSVQLNHTIVWCNDKEKSSAFLVEMLGLQESPIPFGPMLVVRLSNGVSMDFYQQDGKIALQHYAFLVTEEEFDQVFARVKAKGLTFWADPAREKPGEIYRHFGGRGIYFDDPNGHFLEVMTRPYDLGR